MGGRGVFLVGLGLFHGFVISQAAAQCHLVLRNLFLWDFQQWVIRKIPLIEHQVGFFIQFDSFNCTTPFDVSVICKVARPSSLHVTHIGAREKLVASVHHHSNKLVGHSWDFSWLALVRGLACTPENDIYFCQEDIIFLCKWSPASPSLSIVKHTVVT